MLKTFATFPRAMATPCHHASNIKLIKEVNENVLNKTFGFRTTGKAYDKGLLNSVIVN